MKYSVVVIDDEADARALLKIYLTNFTHLKLVGEAANGTEAIRLIEELKPDIALLDIQMPEQNGLEVVQQLKYLPQFIFITAFDEFAVKAFDLNAVDYLLKPFTPERFEKAINRAVARLKQDDNDPSIYQRLITEIQSLQEKTPTYIERIAYKDSQTVLYLNVSDIVMIEAADQYVNVHTKSKKYLIRQSMDYLENKLDPTIFFRTHRSYIVRLDEVKAIEQLGARNIWVFLKQGQKAKLSQVRKQLFQSKLRIG